MSLMLKGIDLPTGVYRVFVVIEGENEETVYRNTVEYTGEALKAVVQIPKGHGRLIDGDEIQAMLIKEAYSGEYTERFPLGSTIKWTPTEAQRIINDNAPTILEGEKR